MHLQLYAHFYKKNGEYVYTVLDSIEEATPQWDQINPPYLKTEKLVHVCKELLSAL